MTDPNCRRAPDPWTRKSNTQGFGKTLSWLLLLAATALGTGCAEDPAPEKIIDVSRWLYRNYATATDERLADAVVALAGSVTAVSADTPFKGLIGALKAGDNEVVGRTGVDATKTVGMMVVTEFNCKLAQVEKIHSAAEQDTLHPSAYTAYQRTFRQNRDDYLARKFQKLDWDTALTSDYASEKLDGSMRFVPDFGKVQSPYGAALVSRTWLKENAVAVASATEWQQDYQIEAYFERTPGKVVHLFAVWRQAQFMGLSNESATLQNLQFGGFVDWDKEVEKACASGKY